MRIRFVTYFRYALILPLVLGALSWILPVDPAFMLLNYALIFAGVPYCIFAIGIMVWSRNKTDRHLKRFAWLLPILFIPFAVAGSLLVGGFPSQSDVLSLILALSGFTLVIGYFYVLLGWLFYSVLRSIKWPVRTTD